jgi:hypothetical protein
MRPARRLDDRPRGSASLSVLFDLIGCASVIIHVDANEIGLGSWAECAGIGRRA